MKEKLIPLIIGKSKNPRALKNVDSMRFNILYRANKTAWLTSHLFDEYLEMINKRFVNDNRKILLLVDNFSGHKIESKSNVELFFFPPNCTSLIQPLDLGIINAFKHKFKSLLTNFQMYNALSNDLSQTEVFKKIDILCVMNWIEKSLNSITKETIKNCWKKANILNIEQRGEINSNFVETDKDSYEDVEDEESNTSLSSVNNVICLDTSDFETHKSHQLVSTLRHTVSLLKATNSKYLKECLDLQDKVIAEVLEEHCKDSLDYYLLKHN
ncbi:Tigger transposable element-derived protein 6, partial [Dictyocoela muelleri]